MISTLVKRSGYRIGDLLFSLPISISLLGALSGWRGQRIACSRRAALMTRCAHFVGVAMLPPLLIRAFSLSLRAPVSRRRRARLLAYRPLVSSTRHDRRYTGGWPIFIATYIAAPLIATLWAVDLPASTNFAAARTF